MLIKAVRKQGCSRRIITRLGTAEIEQGTLDALSLIRSSSPLPRPLEHKDIHQLHAWRLIEDDPLRTEGIMSHVWHSKPWLTVGGLLVAEALDKLASASDEAVVTVWPASTFDLALLARIALGRFRVLGDPGEELLALKLASEAGYAAHPGDRISEFVMGEPALGAAWQQGWSNRAFETRPLTKDDLAAKLEEISKEANQSCGLFYELYEQRFTAAVDGWLPALRANEREMAMELLKGHAYAPDTKGTWVYDDEENDVFLVGGDEEEAVASAELAP
ncbi:hypothetical protein [Cupriavidus sp. TMH.W2]|uniref:hypothetical protein n=1 Tax=Cupriavidus sp. TMH.W2 TaxID=3434465 RepID=UPI003D77C532